MSFISQLWPSTIEAMSIKRCIYLNIINEKGNFTLCKVALRCFFISFLFRHIAFDVKAGQFHFAVSAHCYALLEVSGELAFAVIGYFYRAFLSRRNRLFIVFGSCASARSDDLVYH